MSYRSDLLLMFDFGLIFKVWFGVNYKFGVKVWFRIKVWFRV